MTPFHFSTRRPYRCGRGRRRDLRFQEKNTNSFKLLCYSLVVADGKKAGRRGNCIGGNSFFILLVVADGKKAGRRGNCIGEILFLSFIIWEKSYPKDRSRISRHLFFLLLLIRLLVVVGVAHYSHQQETTNWYNTLGLRSLLGPPQHSGTTALS
jgi:hypothetical protein